MDTIEERLSAVEGQLAELVKAVREMSASVIFAEVRREVKAPRRRGHKPRPSYLRRVQLTRPLPAPPGRAVKPDLLSQQYICLLPPPRSRAAPLAALRDRCEELEATGQIAQLQAAPLAALRDRCEPTVEISKARHAFAAPLAALRDRCEGSPISPRVTCGNEDHCERSPVT